MTKYLFVLFASLFSSLSFAQVNTAKAYVVLNPAGDFVANMKVISGTAYLQDGKYRAKNIVVDLNSMETGLDLRDEHGKNKYLEVKKYPQAVLVEAIGANGVGKGRLKFHGKENIVTGTYKVTNSGKSLSADFIVKLSSFGIADINYKGIGVEDEVRVEVTIPVAAAVATAAAQAAPVAAKTKPAVAAPPAHKK